MKKLLLLTALVFTPVSANAATFTQSDFAGVGNFGTITGTCLNVACDTVGMSLDMSPNVFLQTGSHFLLTLSLGGIGSIDLASIVFGGTATNVAVLPHTSPATYQNSPFKFFSDGISADCGPGGSQGGCGSTLTFNILNFSSFLAATNLFNGNLIFAAADILLGNCNDPGPTGGGCTGVVGVTLNPTPTPFNVPGVPLPPAVWLFGSGLVGLYMASRRKTKRTPIGHDQVAA